MTYQTDPDRGIVYRRLNAALRFSLQGLKRSWQEESIRVQVLLLAILFPLAMWLGNSIAERLLLSLCLFAVIIVELLNTAIEVAIDRISSEKHQLSKEAKDLGSAAVFLTMMCVIFVWAMILIPRAF
jgi:diacylglycerol kinase (ATP)